MKITDLVEAEYANVTEQKKELKQKNSVSQVHKKMRTIITDLADYITKDNEPFWYAYEHFTRKISDELISYTKKDIEECCFMLAEIEADYLDFADFSGLAGNFLSALINVKYEKTHQVEEYVLHTDQFQRKINHLGKENKQNIQIFGDVGNCVGSKMLSGSIYINGSVGTHAFEHMFGGSGVITGNAQGQMGQNMEGGTITLNGTTTHNTGDYMQGGIITICKNAGNFCGVNMQNGLITIQGNAGDCVGYGMINGNIICRENIGEKCGVCMEGGLIKVMGNAGNYLGLVMKKGTILVEGNVGKSIGKDMKGGFIRLNGTYESLAENSLQGKIYAKEKQIWPVVECDMFSSRIV